MISGQASRYNPAMSPPNTKTALKLVTCAVLVLHATGCPHRSPVWSPGGSRILLLGGKNGEEVDKAASTLWLADVSAGSARRLALPAAGVRYLAATWLDDAAFLAFTVKWENDSAEAGSEKAWRGTVDGSWTELKLPPPNAERTTRRLPVVLGEGKDRAIVYHADVYTVIVARVEDGKEILKLDPADLIGPGPRGGFIVTRPEPENASNIEIVAFGKDLKEVWRKKYSALQNEIAGKLGKPPGDVAFNDTSTSHLPPTGEPAWVGITLVFSDVGWKEGIPAYYVRLDAASAATLSAVHGIGLSGRPAGGGKSILAVLAPDAKAGLPPRLTAVSLEDGKTAAEVRLEKLTKEAVHGYSLDPRGERLALSVNGPASALWIYDAAKLGPPKVIDLKE
jgi:hypothetical protein